jgi:hypothetical protein
MKEEDTFARNPPPPELTTTATQIVDFFVDDGVRQCDVKKENEREEIGEIRKGM